MSYVYCKQCDKYTPTETIYGTTTDRCGNCDRTIEHCPNCQTPITEPEWIEDRWGTKFCSVRCCDHYHESTAADMLEA